MRKVIKSILLIICVVILGLMAYEYPRPWIRVHRSMGQADELIVEYHANNLIAHDYVPGEGVWASRGYDIYFKKTGGRFFRRIARLPLPYGESFWGHSRIARERYGIHDLTELMVLRSNTVIAFAGGYIFRKAAGEKRFQRVGQLRRYGLGEGRGVLPTSFTDNRRGEIFFGEYWRNPDNEEVKLWRSIDDGKSWETYKTFEAGHIRHIHAVQHDPHTGKVWVTTGDSSRESQVGYLDASGEYIVVGSGSQKWRTVSLLFTPAYVLWGMDGYDREGNFYIWRWDRTTGETELLQSIDSHAYYSGTGETDMIITTNTWESTAKIWASRDGTNWREAASWEALNDEMTGSIRVVSTSGNDFLVSTVNLTGPPTRVMKVRLKPR